MLADIALGSTVRRGDLLGTITDSLNNASTKLYSSHSGRIICMERNQVVMPGIAAFHVGIQTSEAPVGFSHNDLIDLATEDESDDYVDGMSE